MVRHKIWSNVTWDQLRMVRRAAEIRGCSVAEFVRSEVLPVAEDEVEAHRKMEAGRND